MKIDFEDRVWQFELGDIDVNQGEAIGAYTGLSVMAWYKSLLDPDSLQWLKSARCLYWLIREQNDDPVPLETANFAPLKLFIAFGEALKAGNGDVEPDPTNSGGDAGAATPPAAENSPAG